MSGVEPRAPYRLGFHSQRSEPEVIERMLRFTQLPLEVVWIERIDERTASAVHALLLLNPALEEDELQAFLQYLERGGTALILISVELASHKGSIGTLAALGLRLGQTRSRKELRVDYGRAFPVAFQRGSSARLRLDSAKRFATFRPSREPGPLARYEPLVTTAGLLGGECVAMLVQLGAGRAVVTDSAGQAEDRANLLRELLKHSSLVPEPPERIGDELPRRLAALVQQAFEVYEEIPLEVVRHKLGPEARILSDVELLELLEDLIRSEHVVARLRGSTLVRRW